MQTIDNVQAVFKEATIPTQEVVTEDRDKVAIVFERVNRLGVELDSFQLLSAWTWSDDFDLQDRIEGLALELEPHGFGDISEDRTLILRCCAAIVSGGSSSGIVMGLRGVEVRERFGEIENGVRGAIDFLASNLEVRRLANLPYSAQLVPLAVFFATKGSKGAGLRDEQRRALEQWFWRSSFSRRFSAAVQRNLDRDIVQMAHLRDTGTSSLELLSATVNRSFFTDHSFTRGTVHTKTFILMLANSHPKSFISGARVDLGPVLQDYNREEFHHLMPRSFLRGKGISNTLANRLANFAIISADDNKKLAGDPPSRYCRHMPTDSVGAILEAAICPKSLFADDYSKFLRERSGMLAKRAEYLMGDAIEPTLY